MPYYPLRDVTPRDMFIMSMAGPDPPGYPRRLIGRTIDRHEANSAITIEYFRRSPSSVFGDRDRVKPAPREVAHSDVPGPSPANSCPRVSPLIYHQVMGNEGLEASMAWLRRRVEEVLR